MEGIPGREEFRQSSYFSDIATGVICGFGSLSYELALNAALSICILSKW
jgi:3-dehydroquinate dehydratase-2